MASSFCSPIWSICSSSCLFHIIFSCPCPLPTTSKSNTLLKVSPLSLLKTCPYHCTPLALAGPSKVSFETQKSHQFLASFLYHLYSTHCPHQCFFSSCNLILLQKLCLAPIWHCWSYTTLINSSFHCNSPHSLNFIHSILVFAVTAASLPLLAFNLSPDWQKLYMNSTFSKNISSLGSTIPFIILTHNLQTELLPELKSPSLFLCLY